MALHGRSVVLDSGPYAALRKLVATGKWDNPTQDPKLLNDSERIYINRLRSLDTSLGALTGDPPNLDRKTLVGALDLRATDVVRVENGPIPGIHVGPMATGTPRTDATYQAVLRVLERPPLNPKLPVGKKDGAADRTIVADALFSDTSSGVNRSLATADPNIIDRLARGFPEAGKKDSIVKGQNPAPGESFVQMIARKHPGGFQVDIIPGHPLLVIPLIR